MAIENEIVRFVAELELDQATKDKFIAGLKEADKNCADLRKTIVDTQKSLMEMKSAGKENSEEYKKLEKHLGELNTQYKNTSAHANKFASALGVNQMSMNQLKAYTKKLRKEMDSLRQDANPELWDKYNEKLTEAEKRMKELKGGTKDVGDVFNILNSKMGKAALVFSFVAEIAGKVHKALDRIAQETQAFGDKWQMAHNVISAGWSQLLANISTGSSAMKRSIGDAMRAAREAQGLMDELFERDNSLSIQESKIQGEINELMKTVQNSSLNSSERLDALTKVEGKERDIATMKRDIAQQEMDIALGLLAGEKGRTGLKEEQLVLIIDEYEKNRKLIQQAQEYKKGLGELSKTMISLSSRGLDTSRVQEEIEVYKSGFSDIIVQYAEFLTRYDLANDEMITQYVNARLKLQEADNTLSQSEASNARRKGALINQIESDNTKAREDAYNQRIKSAEEAYGRELIKLKEQLGNREISEAEYRTRSYTAEMAMLVQKRAINQAYGKEIISIDQTIADKRLEIQNTVNSFMEKSREETESMLASMKAESEAFFEEWSKSFAETINNEIENDPSFASNPVLDAVAYKNSSSSVGKDDRLADLKSNFDAEIANIEDLHKYKLISEEEYLARKKKLTEDYLAQERGIQAEGWIGALETAQQVLDGISQATNAAQEAEYANLDAWKSRELAAAGENAEKREQIEAQYEAKKLDIQKKYADVDMGINIAKAIAAGALAIVETWVAAGGNPVLAGIFSALVAVTTAAQVATIIAQRNAIKNAAPGTGGGTSTTTRTVTGYSEGGYTGDGGRLEVAGVVHRGEYVVPQPEMRDPAVAAMVANIETRRRRRTSANALPGFAEGGYTGLAGGGRQTDDILNRILNAIVAGNDNPVPAYVVLSEANAKQETLNRFKKQTSLRR